MMKKNKKISFIDNTNYFDKINESIIHSFSDNIKYTIKNNSQPPSLLTNTLRSVWMQYYPLLNKIVDMYEQLSHKEEWLQNYINHNLLIEDKYNELIYNFENGLPLDSEIDIYNPPNPHMEYFFPQKERTVSHKWDGPCL